MLNTSYSSDITRAYEVSWLASSGKPDIAVVEIRYDANLNQRRIDSMQFKNFLLTLNNQEFSNNQQVQQVLTEYLEKVVKLTAFSMKFYARQDFSNIKFFENSGITQDSLTQQFRYLCVETGQPFIGVAHLCFFAPQTILSAEELGKLVVAWRNEKFHSIDFVDRMYMVLAEMLPMQFVLSVHVSRRGGISYQGLRSNFPVEWNRFYLRSIME